MRKLSVLALFGVLLVLGVSASVASANARAVFKATLTGSQVDPPTDTRAEGRAIFKVGKDGASQDVTRLDCLLNVTGVEDPRSANITDVDGNVLVNLVEVETRFSRRFSGIAVQIPIQEGDSTFLVGDATLEEVIALMGDGGAYIDVRTGEDSEVLIRGQID